MAASKDTAATVPTHAPVANDKAKPVKEADKKSGPDIHDAELNDAPLRSGSPQEPMVGTLTSGAGEHMPVTDPHFGADGRWYADTSDARAASVGHLSDEELTSRFGKARTS